MGTADDVKGDYLRARGLANLARYGPTESNAIASKHPPAALLGSAYVVSVLKLEPVAWV